MLKKFGSILLIVVIMTVYSAGAFAGTTGSGVGITTRTAIVSGGQRSGSTTESAVDKNGAVAGESTTTSESAVNRKSTAAGESTATSESAVNRKSTASSKPEFEDVFEEALKNGKATDNGQLFVTITSPDKDKDFTYKKSYILSGNSEFSDIIITIAKYNENTNEYERMNNTDGESSWEINSTGLFSKEILLAKGVNKIKIIATRTSQREKVNPEIQINCFTIELLNEKIEKQAIKKPEDIRSNIGMDITEGIKSFFEMFNKKSK